MLDRRFIFWAFSPSSAAKYYSMFGFGTPFTKIIPCTGIVIWVFARLGSVAKIICVAFENCFSKQASPIDSH